MMDLIQEIAELLRQAARELCQAIETFSRDSKSPVEPEGHDRTAQVVGDPLRHPDDGPPLLRQHTCHLERPVLVSSSSPCFRNRSISSSEGSTSTRSPRAGRMG